MISECRKVYFNGKFVEEKDARISIYDAALMFGDMVFEMMRTFNRRHFKLREHLERLYAGIKYVRIPINMTIDEMEKAYYNTMEVNEKAFEKNDEIRPLINVSRGPLWIYRHIFGGKLEPTVIIACFPLKWTVAHMAKFYDTGVHVVIPSQRAIPASLMEPKIKNRSRLFYQMANLEAAQVDSEAWPLLLDTDGFITESSGANFFIIKNKKLYTPEPRNILRGISRQYVMDELAKELRISCIEKNIEPYDVYTADEAFFTGTPFCIMPVTRLNNLPIGNCKVGDLTKTLLNIWSEKVKVDIVSQIKKWNKEMKINDNEPISMYQKINKRK